MYSFISLSSGSFPEIYNPALCIRVLKSTIFYEYIYSYKCFFFTPLDSPVDSIPLDSKHLTAREYLTTGTSNGVNSFIAIIFDVFSLKVALCGIFRLIANG